MKRSHSNFVSRLVVSFVLQDRIWTYNLLSDCPLDSSLRGKVACRDQLDQRPDGVADSTSLQCEYVMIRFAYLVESGGDVDIVDLAALDVTRSLGGLKVKAAIL